MMPETSISLKELLVRVKDVIHLEFDGQYWVRADISDLHEDVNRGHCYLELVEKTDGRLVEAKIRASIWASTYRMLKPMFMQATGQPLRTGMKVLVLVSVTFHEQYGLSCVIHSIDPTFTMGDIARKKQETIMQLKEDGIWEMNKQLEMPALVQRIAVISSATAAGYGDFCNQLQNNERGFCFAVTLFPAIMQGEQAAASVVDALDKIYEKCDQFDVVVIIRGGGATTDLLAFDEYSIAASVAQFPLPVLTGIGHERDESVTDMVAHTRCKTPTAVAAFIVERMVEADNELLVLEERLKTEFYDRLKSEEERLAQDADRLLRSFSYYVDLENRNLQMARMRLTSFVEAYLKGKNHQLEMMENTLRLLSPDTLLKRGYSITVSNGKVVKHLSDVQKGDLLETIVADGRLQSIVK